ncbi:MAG: hypothetical protein PHO70_05080 [Candidatus Omnitrophica bacterium]|nr:hypothetical protein [Candidatus Omnitrophota bacterium]
MLSKKIGIKLFLIFGFVSLFLIFKFQGVLKDKGGFSLEKAKINFDNFFAKANPNLERKRPVAFSERESELQSYFGEPFTDFTREEWSQFWNLMYGLFPKEPAGKPGLPNKMRQLTEDEITSELISLYPQPFLMYQDSHWSSLYQVIFKK